MADELRTVDDYEDLLRLVEVDDVVFYELQAKDKAGFPAKDFEIVDESSFPSQIETEDGAYPSYWSLGLNVDEERIGCRARVDVITADARYTADAAIFYRLSEPVFVVEEVLTRFVQHLAFFGLYPYMREALQTSAARLRNNPPLLPVIRAGALRMSVREAPSEDVD